MSDATTSPPPIPAASESTSRTEPLAIWSLVLSILSFLGCLFLTVVPAIICGHVARSRIRKSNGALQGMNLALASLIVAYFQVPIGILGGIMVVDMIRSERVRLHELAEQKKEIASDDGKSKITASGFWVQRTDLNQRAALQAACKSEEMYVIVIGEAKSTVPNIALSQHHQLTRERMLQSMEESSATQPMSLTIDGHPALQDEVSGAQSGTHLTFLHTTVDADDSFQQILAWTVKARWQKHRDELRDVTNSFQGEK